jgi:hypothetical protein
MASLLHGIAMGWQKKKRVPTSIAPSPASESGPSGTVQFLLWLGTEILAGSGPGIVNAIDLMSRAKVGQGSDLSRPIILP